MDPNSGAVRKSHFLLSPYFFFLWYFSFFPCIDLSFLRGRGTNIGKIMRLSEINGLYSFICTPLLIIREQLHKIKDNFSYFVALCNVGGKVNPSTSQNRQIIGFAWAGWIFDFYDLILYSFLLIYIAKSFDLSRHELGLVYSASLAITAIGGITLGYVGDRIGRRPAIIGSVLIFSIGTFLSAFAWDLASLLVFRIITGFGIGGEWAAGHTLVNETLPKGERGRASAIIQSGAPIGVALASITGAFLTPLIGWRMSFLLASLPSFLLVLFMIRYLPESPKFLIFKAEAKDERNEKNQDVPTGVRYIRQATKRSWDVLIEIRKPLAMGTILSLFGMLAYWVIFAWTPEYLDEIGFTNQQIGYWMLLSQLGAFIGYLSFGIVVDKSGKFKLTFASYALLFALGVLVFTQGLERGALLFSLSGIFFTGLGTGFFSGYGPLYSKIFPTRVRNSSASFCFNTGRLGAFVAPLLVAYAADIIGFSAAIGLGSAFAILAAFWVFLIPIPRKDHEEGLQTLNERLLTLSPTKAKNKIIIEH